MVIACSRRAHTTDSAIGRQCVAASRAHSLCQCLLAVVGSVTSRTEGIMNVSLTPELEKFVDGKVESGLYNNASEVIRESLRLLKEHDEIRLKWREQIERGWLEAQSGQVVDGPKAMADARQRLKSLSKKRA